jgi:hypothetical protein
MKLSDKKVFTKSRGVRALFVLSLVGATHPSLLLSPSPVWAQEATPAAPNSAVVAKTDDLAKITSRVKQEDVCKTPVTLSVENANLRKIIAQLKSLLPPDTQIELRNPSSLARFSFELAKVPVGDVLEPVAKLAGCKLYVLSDRLLITRDNQLSSSERLDAKDWAKNRAVTGFGGWSARSTAERAFSRAIFAELQQRKGTEARWSFSELSQDCQQMLQSMVTWTNDNANHLNIRVPRDAAVAIEAGDEPGRFSLKVGNLESGDSGGRHYYFYGLR